MRHLIIHGSANHVGRCHEVYPSGTTVRPTVRPPQLSRGFEPQLKNEYMHGLPFPDADKNETQHINYFPGILGSPLLLWLCAEGARSFTG